MFDSIAATLHRMTENTHALVPIYTIGYGGRSIEQFVAALQHYGIRYLVDVRTAPYSRFKPEFSKAPLESALQKAGIRYVYMGDTLGGQPADADCYTDGKVDYEKVKTKDFYLQGIERIRTAFEQRQSVALMCSEGKPEQCHRSKLIAPSLLEIGVAVEHIDENDQIKHQEEVLFVLTGGQLGLFGESFTSRKRYRPGDIRLEDEDRSEDQEALDDTF